MVLRQLWVCVWGGIVKLAVVVMQVADLNTGVIYRVVTTLMQIIFREREGL